MTAENVFILTNESMQYREISLYCKPPGSEERRASHDPIRSRGRLKPTFANHGPKPTKELALLVPSSIRALKLPRNVAQNLNVLEHHFARRPD